MPSSKRNVGPEIHSADYDFEQFRMVFVKVCYVACNVTSKVTLEMKRIFKNQSKTSFFFLNLKFAKISNFEVFYHVKISIFSENLNFLKKIFLPKISIFFRKSLFFPKISIFSENLNFFRKSQFFDTYLISFLENLNFLIHNLSFRKSQFFDNLSFKKSQFFEISFFRKSQFFGNFIFFRIFSLLEISFM